MGKRMLKMLERAFDAEIGAAFSNGVDIFQTKSKLANELVEEGYLIEAEMTLHGRVPVTVKGYRLTHLGRLTYCSTCEGEG